MTTTRSGSPMRHRTSALLLLAVAGSLALAGCGRRAPLETPSAAVSRSASDDQRIAGPLAVPIGNDTGTTARNDDDLARAAVADINSGTLETQDNDAGDIRADRPDRPFFLDSLLD